MREGKRGAKMSNRNRDAKVDRLLHDAEHALSGANFAKSIGHVRPEKELRQKHDRLVAEAQEIDPAHKAPAWAAHKEWLMQ